MADEIGMVERVARAIYDALDRESEYVGDYEFYGGLTTLDGQFDLKQIARAVIASLMESDEGVVERMNAIEAEYKRQLKSFDVTGFCYLAYLAALQHALGEQK